MRHTFVRTAPTKISEPHGIPVGWFVISHRLIHQKHDRVLAHGRWFRIEGPGGRIYRILRFSPNLKSSTPDAEIIIDWQGWLDLHGRVENIKVALELEISGVRWWQTPVLAVAHPDPAVRVAGVLGLVSVALGVLSILLTFVS